MRFIMTEKADPKGKAKTRYMFALGIEEAELMFSLLVKARRYMPERNEEAIREGHRISNMLKAIREALPVFKKGKK